MAAHLLVISPNCTIYVGASTSQSSKHAQNSFFLPLTACPFDQVALRLKEAGLDGLLGAKEAPAPICMSVNVETSSAATIIMSE
jgi:hypothetical protein